MAQGQKYEEPMRIKIFSNIRGLLNKFPDFFCMGTFIDSTHMKF